MPHFTRGCGAMSSASHSCLRAALRGIPVHGHAHGHARTHARTHASLHRLVEAGEATVVLADATIDLVAIAACEKHVNIE